MSSRELILSKLRAVDINPRQLPDVPMFDQVLPPPLLQFQSTLARMGGTWVDAPSHGNLERCIRERFPDARVICSAVPEITGTHRLDETLQPAELNNVDVGIVRAGFAVAETGSLWISEREYRVNTLGYLPQHLVALLDPADIVGNLHHAYHRHEFREVNYCVLMSGPSATADIEGVLIRGAQGVRSLTVIPVNRSSAMCNVTLAR